MKVKDLILDKSYKKGSKRNKVRLIQEWLCLNGLGVCVDGDFGAAMDYAVRLFQRREGLKVDGIVGKKTFSKLIQPMRNALKSIASNGKSLGQMVAAYAEQHLKANPREIGGAEQRTLVSSLYGWE